MFAQVTLFNKILIHIFVILVSLIVLPRYVFCEKPFAYFDHFTQNQGLSNNAIRCMLQDKKGFLWIGTEFGLNRYDGYNFKNYTYPHSLPANSIFAIYEDTHDNLWLTTSSGDLIKYNREMDLFEKIAKLKRPTLQEATLWGQNICQDDQNMFWFATNQGIVKFNPKNNQTTHYLDDITDVTDIVQDNQGNFWLNTVKSLYSFDPKTEKITGNFILASKGVTAVSPGNTLLLLPDGNILVINRGSLFVFDSIKKQLILKYEELNDFEITTMFLADKNVLWLGTYKKGIVKFDLLSRQFIHFEANPKLNNSLVGNQVSAIIQDKAGIIWIGDASYGLNKFSPYSNLFQLYKNNPFDDNTISNNYIRGITQDTSGALWVATQFGGLNKIDRKTGKITRYQADANNPNSISSNTVWNVYQDRKGVLWVGLENGLQTFNPAKNSFSSVYPKKVTSILEDKKGRLWLGTAEKLYLMSEDRKSVIDYTKTYLTNWDIGNEVQTIFEDSTGKIWIGGIYGFLCFDPELNQITYSIPKTFSRTYIACFLEDKEKNIWIATKGDGIYCFNPVTNTFIHITEIDGLPHNNTYGIFADETENFWISTDNGITKYNPKTKIFETFTINDGLQGKEFNRFAFFKNSEGEIFFGGINGLNSFNPLRIFKNPTPPSVIITEFLATGSYVPLPKNQETAIELNFTEKFFQISFAAMDFNSPENNLYKYRLIGLNKDWIQLRGKNTVNYTNLFPGEYVFEVTGTNNHQVWQDKITRLKIVIFPPPWRSPWAYFIYISLIISSIFFIIRFQTHKLTIKANIQEAHLRAEAAETQARIAEAQAKAATFEAQIVETQKQNLEKENLQRLEAETKIKQKNLELEEANLKLKELDEIKAKFAAMLVHDLKSPLTVVHLTLDVLLAKMDDPDPELVNMVYNSEESIKKIVSLVDEMLEFYRSDSQEMKFNLQDTNLQETLNYSLEIAKIAANKKNISIDLIIKNSVPFVFADSSKLERVFSNLLSNAIKFTPEDGQISLEVWTEKGVGVETGLDLVNISITDTGEGIPPEELAFIFDPYRQATSKHSVVGVGLGLAIAKRILAAHKGNISVHSQVGIGSSFTVTLPALPETTKTETPKPVSYTRISPDPCLSGLVMTSSTLPKKILIVDDELLNRKILSKKLISLGYQVDAATTGKEAIKAYTNNRPDLILMDHYMPEMNGLEATTEIRQLEGTTGKHTIIILVTASSKDVISEYGNVIDDCVEKPFNFNQLEAVMKHLIESSEALTLNS